ncbi:MAG TPA: ABC transporter substrate-binding protein, partial [Accumulibacter sp.]|nr:ABC transporter substrate-binding protein [Accumulibacter sp.]
MTLTRLPQRIVCLTSETVEVLYALGEQARIVGISGYTVHPPQARKEKPKVFAFTSGDLQRILAVAPDLVLTFSDLQAEIVGQLIRAGVAVHAFNQRRVDGILAMIETVGRLVGAETRALALVAELSALIDETRQAATTLAQRPRVYFEEWDQPLMSAIGWVSELITIAGGDDVFAERAIQPSARERIIADP